MELLPTVEGGLPKEWVRRVTARYELARRGALPAYRLFEAAPRRIEDGALLAEIADALWSEGHVLEALGAYERLVAMHPDDQVLRRRRDAALSEARWLLDAEDPVADDAGEPATPVAGRVMYLVADAFPFTRSPTGEALHARARSLLSAGWQPTVVTLLPQPWNLDATDVALCERIDGVEYVRLLPAGPVDGPPNEVLAENFRALADVARHVRPAVIHVENDVLAAMAGTALGRSLKVPAVWEVRSLPHEAWAEADATRSKDRQYYRLWKRLVRRCLNDAHTVVTTSPAMRQHVLDLGIAPARAKHFAGPLVEATPAAAEHWRALYEAASTTDTSQDESAIAATGSGNRP
jgi:hypothetical protein